jgi:predicted MFS family arabinose efflux permease
MSLFKNTNLRALLPSVFVSSAGDWIFQIAILLYIFTDSQSAMMISAFVLTSALPSLFLSPVIIRYITKFSNKHVLVAADIIRAALVGLLILLHDSMVAIFVINALVGLCSVAFNSAYVKNNTTLFDSDIRHRVNAILNSGTYMAMILGSLIGATLITNISLELCLVADAASFILSALFLIKLKNTPVQTEQNDGPQKKTSIWEMMSAIKTEVQQSMVLSSVIIFGLSWGVIGGAFTVLLPVMFMTADSGVDLLSTFYSTQAIALIFGSFIVYKIDFKKENNRLFRTFSIAYFFQAICFAVALFSPFWLLTFVAIFLMRLCSGIIIPLDTTLIQNNSSKASLPFVYSVHGLIYKTCYQVSVVTVGIMIDTLTIDVTKTIVGWTAIIVISTISLVAVSWSYKHSTTKEVLDNG